MGASLRVFLTPEQDRTLFELRTGTNLPQRTKDRAEALRLNARGWKIPKIAAYFGWEQQTVRQTIHRWNKKGLGGLWDAPGRGAKRRWQQADIAYLEDCLEQEPRTYNSRQLAQKLESDLRFALLASLSPSSFECRPIATDTQKKGLIWKRTRQSHRNKQNPQQQQLKQADLDMLELAAATGEIDLKYLDESGFCLWSPVSYSYIMHRAAKTLRANATSG